MSILQLAPPTKALEIGSSLRVGVQVDGADSVNAVQVDLSYPADKLRLETVDRSNSAFGIEAENTSTPGLLKMARGTIVPVTGSQVVAVLTFTALAPGAAALEFLTTCKVLRVPDSENVLTQATGGMFTIAGADNLPPASPVGFTLK